MRRNVYGVSRPGTTAPVVVPTAPANDSGRMEAALAFERKEKAIVSRDITALSLKVLSAEEILKMSVLEVTKPLPSTDRTFSSGHVNDYLLGTTDLKITCATCNKDMMGCPGHIGHIRLAVPIMNLLFLEYVIKVMNCLCSWCGDLYITDEKFSEVEHLRGLQRLIRIEELSRGLHCHRKPSGGKVLACGAPRLFKGKKDSKKSNNLVYTIGASSTTEEMPVGIHANQVGIISVYSILQRITPEVSLKLGFPPGSHPKDMIFTLLPVIPKAARPTVLFDGSLKQDPLTEIYNEIVVVNNLLTSMIENHESEMNTNAKVKELFNVVSNLIDNKRGDADSNEKNNQPVDGFKQLIQGKEAILRGLMMGKRVNFSGRTVLGGDASLKFGQIRIPRSMASTLGKDVQVTPYNLEEVQGLLKQSLVTHITKGKGPSKGVTLTVERIKERNNDQEIVVEIGDTIRRHLRSGDHVIFNRQPTLHKTSIMSAEVVIGDQETIGIPIAYNKPLNADYDGDEMNIHVVANYSALLEQRMKMDVCENLVSSETGGMAMGLDYDALTGLYLMTLRNENVDPDLGDDIRLSMKEGNPDFDSEDHIRRCQAAGIDPLSGKGLFSMCLPPGLYYRSVSDISVDVSTLLRETHVGLEGRGAVLEVEPGVKTRNVVQIEDGILVSGIINKRHIGASHGTIGQHIVREWSAERCARFYTCVAWLNDIWLSNYGFTIGLFSCIPHALAKDESGRVLYVVNDKVVAYETRIDEASGTTTYWLDGVQVSSLELGRPLRAYEQIRREVSRATTEAVLKVDALGPRPTDPVELDRYEQEVRIILNEVMKKGSILTRYLNPADPLPAMNLGGAKGKDENTMQIAGAVGQQYSQAARLQQRIDSGKRCTAYQLEQDNPTLMDLGFCPNPLVTGLSPLEYVSLHAAARESMVTTTTKTQDTGKMQREMIKALEDTRVERVDGTVRNGDYIVSFLYGGDGLQTQNLIQMPSRRGAKNSDWVLLPYNLQFLCQNINGSIESGHQLFRNDAMP